MSISCSEGNRNYGISFLFNRQLRTINGHYRKSKFDDLAKSPQCPVIVIPVPHPVRDRLRQESSHFGLLRIPVFIEMTGFLTPYDIVKFILSFFVFSFFHPFVIGIPSLVQAWSGWASPESVISPSLMPFLKSAYEAALRSATIFTNPFAIILAENEGNV